MSNISKEQAEGQVRDRLKQVILNFDWNGTRISTGQAERLADALLIHVGGDLAEAKTELWQVHDIAASAQRAGELLDPSRILGVVGWPLPSGPTHCAHWVEGDGPCCRCKAAPWCGDDGATPEAEADYEARKGGCTAVEAA